MNIRYFALTVTVAWSLVAAGEGITAKGRLAQLQEKKSVIEKYIIPAASAAAGQYDDNDARTQAVRARVLISYAEGLASAQEQGGVHLSSLEDRQINGVIEQVDPHDLADMLIQQLEDDQAPAYGHVYQAIRDMPGLVTHNGVDLAKRQYDQDLRNGHSIVFSEGVLAAAKLIAKHNRKRPGHAPADVLPVYAEGHTMAESLFSGETHDTGLLSASE